MTDELKPVRCGCGGEAEIFQIAPEGGVKSYCVRCEDCLTQTRFFTGDKDKAIEAWNRAMDNRMELQTVKERTAKVKVTNCITSDNSDVYIVNSGYCECGALVFNDSRLKYCPQCGARLEWE